MKICLEGVRGINYSTRFWSIRDSLRRNDCLGQRSTANNLNARHVSPSLGTTAIVAPRR